MKKKLKVEIVGPCASGKTTLIAALEERGLWGKLIAQEHSYVPDMWSRLTGPDVLVYLHVSYSVSLERRHMNWSYHEYLEQIHRLENALQHADLYIDTDPLTSEQVLQRVLDFLSDL